MTVWNTWLAYAVYGSLVGSLKIVSIKPAGAGGPAVEKCFL